MKIITQKRKRCLTLLMSLSLIFTSVIRVSAAPSTPLNFEEVDPKFLAQVKDNSNSLSSFTPDPDAVVRIMVELEDEPLVEKEEVLPNALTRGIQATSSVSAHEQEILEAKQDTVLEKVQEIDPEAELIDQFTYLSNSISVESTAKNLDAFKSLDGVRRAFIEKEYTIPKPQMFTSNGLIRSNVVWNTLDIHGEGMTVAVLDTGLDTDHPAFNVDPANPKLNQDDIVTLMSGLDNNHVIKRRNINLEDLYLNPKVPYRFDYAEQRVSVKPTAENYSNIDHGTHVSGTVAGNDGHDFKGVAPEAQILSFKVFNDEGGGAYDSIIVAALEDAVRLEVDAINMSLGSDAGFTSDSSDFVNDVHERISKKGILVSASAGNATSSAHKNNYGTDLSLAIDPDHGIVGSPSTYNGPLSIASSENTEMITVSFEVDGEPIDFINTSHPITELAGQHDFVVVPNIGLPEDYEGIDVTGKIAFVQRGEIAFSEKINHAADKGAIGVVIFGTNEDRIQMQLENTKVPSAYITLSNYERIEATGLTTIIINDQEKAFSNPAAGQPSDFTSFGTTPHLNIKPEISAPGGQIYSTLPSQGPNNYGSMSGTSMAAPHVAGAAALVKQYLKQNNSLASDVQLRDLMDNLLMSTATINHDENGVPYPVRQQGSGNMDVYGALSSPAFLSVQPNLNDDGSTRPKLELKDDAEQSGIYHVEFDVTNISDKPQTYTISADLGTPGVVDVDYSGTENAALGVKTFMSDKNRRLETKVEGPKSVHINPGKTQSVSLTLSISDADKALMAEQFENGIYVEGFIVLSNKTDAKASDLSIPLLAFFGSWEKAPIFDHADIYSKDMVASNFHHLLVSGEWLLGSDFINTENIEVDPGRLVLSPNGDDQLDQLDFITVGQLRNAKDLLLTVTDKDGNEIYSQTRNDAFKTYYNNKESRHVPYTSYPQGAFDPISFNDFEDGSYTLSVQADLGYTKGYDDEVSWTIHVDRVAPTITDTQLIDDKLQITVSDTNFMSISGVYAIINGEPFFKSPLSTNYTPNDLIKEHTLEVDLELLRSIGIKQFYVTAVDAGMNESGFIFDVPEIETEPVDDIVVLTVDETYQIDTEGATYSSEDETIATVDEKGLITALSEGQTVVSAEVNGATTRTWVHVNAKEGFTFDETHYVLNVNETRNIGLTGNDEALDIDLFEFEISDDAIVSLEKSAITGLKLGKAVLTAVSKEDPTDFKKILIEVVDLDRQALTLAIKSTESLEETNYTAESWGSLNEAVSHAAEVLESAKTQDELDAATEALNAAIEALKVSIKNLNESYTLELGTVKRVSPTPTDGTWSYDESTVNVTKDINGYVIEPLVTGNVTLAYTTNEGVTQIITLTVTPKPVIEKPATGTDKPVGDPKDKETPSDQKPKPPVKKDEEGKVESNDSTLPTTGVGLNLTPAVLILAGTALIVGVYLKRKTSHSHSL